jgi:hypothetical protein
MQATAEELAYCAGVLDSDGHIGVHINSYKVRSGKWKDSKQPTFQPRVVVKQMDEGAILLFHQLFEGHRYIDYTNNRGSKRPIFVWQVHSKSVLRALVPLRPYLRIKGRQADLAIELCALNASPRRHTFCLPEIVEGEAMVPLGEACERAGRSYATGIQSVKLGNIPFERRKRSGRGTSSIFVPESYIETWRTRGRGAMRRPEVTERMTAIHGEILSLNSGARGQKVAARVRAIY